ncbi:MAG TPA: cold shock domain-containing protein, partial [Planctomycetota bacterium]|nr:cold shock domain-containing protein [Planctomycetota bacterium]
ARRVQLVREDRRTRMTAPTTTLQQGWVTEVFPNEGYGFLADETGREVFFHAADVAGGLFAWLAQGDAVRFVESAEHTVPTAARVERVEAQG